MDQIALSTCASRHPANKTDGKSNQVHTYTVHPKRSEKEKFNFNSKLKQVKWPLFLSKVYRHLLPRHCQTPPTIIAR